MEGIIILALIIITWIMAGTWPPTVYESRSIARFVMADG